MTEIVNKSPLCTTVQSVMVRTVSPWAAALEPEAQSAEKSCVPTNFAAAACMAARSSAGRSGGRCQTERIIHPCVQQIVVIGLGVGGVTRMKAVRHRLDVHRAYIRRQMGVERRDKLLHRHPASIAEAERETPRMDAASVREQPLHRAAGPARPAWHPAKRRRLSVHWAAPENLRSLYPCRKSKVDRS